MIHRDLKQFDDSIKEIQIVEAIEDILTSEYRIRLFSSVWDIKEAIDISCYLMKKYTNMKNYAIAKTLNRSTASDFPTKSTHNIEKRKADANFSARLLDIEIQLLNYIKAHQLS